MPVVAPVANAAVACTVNYSVPSDWYSGFVADVSIKNDGDPINGWTLTWTFPDGQQVTNLWNGNHAQSGAKVTVTPVDWNKNIGTGGTASFGFQSTRGSVNGKPTDFAVNGVSCTGANKAPTVSLISPTAGQSFQNGQAIPLAASASDSDGTVSKVEFLADGVVVGSDTTAPFEGSWTGAAVGEHALAARATDNRGAVTTSALVPVKVAAGAAIVTNPTTLTVKQGGTATFGVTLASQPSSPVTVLIARTSTSSPDLTAAPTSLTFTTANWNTAQNVTVTSAANGGDLGTANFSAVSNGYLAASVLAKEISANVPPFQEAFLVQYNKIKDPASGYFRKFGDLLVPYHAVETLMVEAPDHGHQTTSEAFSYYLWLEASYGKVSGDWAPFKSAWASMEKFIIPAKADQPTNDKYNPAKPATYAPEHDKMSGYPSELDANVPVGQDPIAAELKSAYGTDDV
ncbi:MAG: glycoside hydrolase family 48 protein, partial [Umezawaea sp.]